MNTVWPFDQPRNCATITSRRVMVEGAWIANVYHDKDDHGWQFHPVGGTQIEESMLVALSELADLDESILSLADLPPGWMAWRDSPGGPWQRKRSFDNGGIYEDVE